MTSDAEIEAIAKTVYQKTRHFDNDRIASLIIRLMDCFEDNLDWMEPVRDHIVDSVESLEE